MIDYLAPLSDALVAKLVSNVTQVMLGLTFSTSDDAVDPGMLCRHMSLIPIAGESPVTIGLSTDDSGSVVISAAMFSCPVGSVDEAMKCDALNELVNMTAGQIKSALLLDQALGLPKVVAETKSFLRNPKWTTFLLTTGTINLMVWISPSIIAADPMETMQ